MSASNGSEFSTILEIKSNGSRLVGGWTTFLFVLKEQEFIPYLLGDTVTPRGCLKIVGCQAAKLPFEENDGKKYTFKLASDTTAYVFNAPNEITRERVITLLNFAAACPNWFNPYSLTATLDLSEDQNEVTRVFFSSLHAQVAASRVSKLFLAIRAKKRVARLLAQYPELYLVSVNKVSSENTIQNGLFAYVSGLVVKPDPQQIDIFNQPHKTTVPVCMASTPLITTASAFHVAIASHSSALSYLSVALFRAEEKDKPLQESLGIAFLPVSDVPRRPPQQAEYTPYSATLSLEPYTLPNLTAARNPAPYTGGPTSPPAGPLTAHGHELDATDAQSVASVSVCGTELDTHAHLDDTSHAPSSPVSTATGIKTQEQNGNDVPTGPQLRGTSLQNAIVGSVSLTIYTPLAAYTMCGWLLKKSDTFMFGGSYRPYWFVLMNGELQYFQQQPGSEALALDQPKKLLLCKNITAVTYKSGVIAVHFKQRGTKGVWYMKSSPAHAPQSPQSSDSPESTPTHKHNAEKVDTVTTAMIERTWVRRITRSSPHVPDPDLQMAADKLLYPQSQVSARSVRTKSQLEEDVPHELVRTFSKERRPSSFNMGRPGNVEN